MELEYSDKLYHAIKGYEKIEIPLPDLKSIIRPLFEEAGFDYTYDDENKSFTINIGPHYMVEGSLNRKTGDGAVCCIRVCAKSEYSNAFSFAPETIEKIMPRIKYIVDRLKEYKKEQEGEEELLSKVEEYLRTKEKSGVKYLSKYSKKDKDVLCVKVRTELFPKVYLETTASPEDYMAAIDQLIQVRSQVSPAFLNHDFCNFEGIAKIIYRCYWGYTQGLNKDYTEHVNYWFGPSFKPYSKKSFKKPKSQELVKVLNQLHLEYGYTDNGDFIIQYLNDQNYVLLWNEIDQKLYDYHYYLTKKGTILKRNSSQKGLIEQLTEEEVIKFIVLLARHGAFAREYAADLPLRLWLMSAMTKNILSHGMTVAVHFRNKWSGIGMSQEFAIRFPHGLIAFKWRSLKEFLNNTVRFTEADKIFQELYKLDTMMPKVRICTDLKSSIW